MIGRLLKGALSVLSFILIAGVSGYITLSFMIKSEDRVVVPDLVSKEAVSIFEMLAQLGLNAKVKGSEYNDHIPINHIISQDPAPGSEIKKGRDVRLILSKGPKTVMIPNLKGLPLRQAQIILKENGLCSGNVSRAYSSRFSKDRVIAHSPGSGQILEQGKCVDVLICQGVLPRTYMMPDLDGMLFAEAVHILEKMNLYSGEVVFFRRDDRKENTIIGQNPLPGYRITEGSPFKLVRNRDPDPGGGPPIPDFKGAHLFRYRLKNGLLRSHIRVKLDGLGISDNLIDDYFNPGDEVLLLIPKGSMATVSLFDAGELIVLKSYDAH